MGNSKSNQHNGLLEMPPHVRQLHYAVMTNDRETVNILIEKGVNVNFPWYNPSNPSVKDGATPLLIAVSLNHTDIIGTLLNSGAYINKCDRQGCTPMYKAAFHGRPYLIEYLSKSGADVNLADFVGKTPLYICVNNCIVHTFTGKAAVQKLISAGAIVDKRDRSGQAPIHMASRWKLCEIVKLLLKAQSDVNLADKKGYTPLYMCVSCLSTKLYYEDLRHQLPCIIALHKYNADMLNFIEWLHFKGPGLTYELVNEFADSESLWQWYIIEKARPQTLKNLCRKVIQKSLCRQGPLTDLVKTLPLPTALRQFLSRRMFFREQDCAYYRNNSGTLL